MKLHFTALNWSNRIWQDATKAIHCMKQTAIWKPKQYKITATLAPRNILELQLHSSFYSWILHGNRFALASLTTSSEFETRKFHTIISQLHYRKAFCSYTCILVVHFISSAIWGLQKLELVGMVSYHDIRGLQPFAIAGRITFIYMKYVAPPFWFGQL